MKFIKETIRPSSQPGANIPVWALYDRYQAWCADADQRVIPISRAAFGRKFGPLGYRIEARYLNEESVRCVIGVEYKTDYSGQKCSSCGKSAGQAPMTVVADTPGFLWGFSSERSIFNLIICAKCAPKAVFGEGSAGKTLAEMICEAEPTLVVDE